MKPWQAAKNALNFGAPLNDLEQQEDDFYEPYMETAKPSQKITKLIYRTFPYTYSDEVERLNGETHCQDHRSNARPENAQAQIIKIDESIMWQLKPLEDLLERLYLLRDIRKEFYNLSD